MSIGHYVEFNCGSLIENNYHLYKFIPKSLDFFVPLYGSFTLFSVFFSTFPYCYFQLPLHFKLFLYTWITLMIHPLEARKTRFASLAALRAYPVPGDSFVPIRCGLVSFHFRYRWHHWYHSIGPYVSISLVHWNVEMCSVCWTLSFWCPDNTLALISDAIGCLSMRWPVRHSVSMKRMRLRF